MYRTMFVPLDGTPLAEHALPFASHLAARAGARIVLVRAVKEGSDTATVEAARAYLNTLAEGLRATTPSVETAVVIGEASAALAQAAERAGADLAIMATSGHGLLGRGGGPSVSDGLLARVGIPILLVRDWHAAEAIERPPPGQRSGPRIVVPLDGSPLAALALPAAREFAAILRGEIVLLRAVPTNQAWMPPGSSPGAGDRSARQTHEARAYLREVALTLRARGFPVRCEVEAGKPPEVVHSIVRRHRAALLIMATHGETGSPGMPLGSVARQVLWGADAPIVLIHPTMPRQSEPEGLPLDFPALAPQVGPGGG